MYTNNETDLLNVVKKHLDKGDTKFQLYFAERTFDKRLLDEILDGFCGIPLPENLNLTLNFSTSNVEDDLVEYLANKLSKINWPSKFKLSLLLRNNLIDNKAANLLLDLFTKFNKFPGAEVVIDLDNNNSLSPSVIDNALKKINNSAIIDNNVVSKDRSKSIRFCEYLIQDFLGIGNESSDDS